MPADSRFYALLSAAESGWRNRSSDDGLLSLALPLDGIDPMWALAGLDSEQNFRMPVSYTHLTLPPTPYV